MGTDMIEVVAAGFDGGTDATDHLVTWVACADEYQTALGLMVKGAGGVMGDDGLEGVDPGMADFRFPAQVSELATWLVGGE